MYLYKISIYFTLNINLRTEFKEDRRRNTATVLVSETNRIVSVTLVFYDRLHPCFIVTNIAHIIINVKLNISKFI